MNFFLIQDILRNSVSQDELTFYRKKSELVKNLEQSIRRARKPFRKQVLRDCLNLLKKETPLSVMWFERVEAAKETAHLQDWSDL